MTRAGKIIVGLAVLVVLGLVIYVTSLHSKVDNLTRRLERSESGRHPIDGHSPAPWSPPPTTAHNLARAEHPRPPDAHTQAPPEAWQHNDDEPDETVALDAESPPKAAQTEQTQVRWEDIPDYREASTPQQRRELLVNARKAAVSEEDWRKQLLREMEDPNPDDHFEEFARVFSPTDEQMPAVREVFDRHFAEHMQRLQVLVEAGKNTRGARASMRREICQALGSVLTREQLDGASCP